MSDRLAVQYKFDEWWVYMKIDLPIMKPSPMVALQFAFSHRLSRARFVMLRSNEALCRYFRDLGSNRRQELGMALPFGRPLDILIHHSTPLWREFVVLCFNERPYCRRGTEASRSLTN